MLKKKDKIILNTTGVIKDLNNEIIDFLKYVEHSDDKTAEESTGTLVKNIHKKVVEVKNNPKMEVEFMTLLERDREKLEEGREEGREEGIKEVAIKLLDILDDKTISEKTDLDIEIVRKLRAENL